MISKDSVIGAALMILQGTINLAIFWPGAPEFPSSISDVDHRDPGLLCALKPPGLFCPSALSTKSCLSLPPSDLIEAFAPSARHLVSMLGDRRSSLSLSAKV
jgi:hypothetical protein